MRSSSLGRYERCKGAPRAERGMPERPEQVWTGDGRLVHDALKLDGSPVSLSPSLVEVVDSMALSTQYLLDKIFPEGQPGIERLELIRERDEPFYVESGGEKIVSGHPDLIQIGNIYGKRVALILDYKSGFLEVSAPEVNMQLRSYAVMVWQDKAFNVSAVYATIVPRLGLPKVPVYYDTDDLAEALLNIEELHEASKDEAAPRTPSVEACRYCRCRATSACVETLNPDKRLIEMPSLINLTPAEKGALLNLCEIVAGNIKMLKDRLYDELAENPEAVEGWLLAPGDFRSSIPDAARAYERVQDLMTPEEFQACLSVKMGDFKEEIKGKLRDKEGIKGKVLSSRLENVLEPMIVRKQGDPKLERKE